jgi:hypothetical protein
VQLLKRGLLLRPLLLILGEGVEAGAMSTGLVKSKKRFLHCKNLNDQTWNLSVLDITSPKKLSRSTTYEFLSAKVPLKEIVANLTSE